MNIPDKPTIPQMPKIKTDGRIAQPSNTPKRIYRSFCVVGNGQPANTCEDLNKKISSLLEYGWAIERIDCHDNIYGIWNGDERKYYPTKDYVIIASAEEN